MHRKNETDDLLHRLSNVNRSGKGWTARCPAHDDRQNSLSIDHRDGRWLLKCHAGCDWQSILDRLGIASSALFSHPSIGGGGSVPLGNHATAQPALTLADYAAAKGLPVEFLQGCHLTEFNYRGNPAVRIPYLADSTEELAVRFRIALAGDRFRWKSDCKPHLYGLDRLAAARTRGIVVLVEGESDCHTLWFHGIPALGVPGAANWKEERDARQLDGIETIFVVIEPDRGGEAVKSWLSRSTIRHRARLVRLPTKDPSALHLDDAAQFKRRWQEACDAAVPWQSEEAAADATRRQDAWQECSALAQEPDILASFAADLERAGMVGEQRAAKLIYLTVVSRLLDRPVSLAIKGPSSAGKSFVVESVLKFFPPEAFYALTAMSERALAYSTEPLKHRQLVIYEAAGMSSEFGSYLIRSLLSEGRLRYETVDKTKDGMVARQIEREGPTGLIVTTTSIRLHSENETRLLSVTISDTPAQTSAVFRALAEESPSKEADLGRWRALQVWLASSPTDVTIPFAGRLAGIVPPVAVRLRRDFRTLLMLIRAHALLHQASRERDAKGRTIATLEDYAAVRALIADLVAEGVEATLKPETREVVAAVKHLIDEGHASVGQVELKKFLPLGKSAISRRVAAAVDSGYLKNLQQNKGGPARLVLGDPLPEEREVLPAPHLLEVPAMQLHGCAVDRGDTQPSSPMEEESDELSWLSIPETPWDGEVWRDRL